MEPHQQINQRQCILIDCFNIVTLASSHSALPDGGDYTETCRSCINVNFNTPFNPLNAELNPICYLLALLELTIFSTLAG